MEKINKLTDEQINRLCILTEKYKMLYEGDYIFSDEGEGCNPSIEKRIRVAPKIKSLYEEFSKYMTNESMDVQYSYDQKINLDWGLRTLKELWLDEVRFFYEDEDEFKPQPQPESPIKPTNKCILPEKIVNEAINAGLLERAENGLKWVQTASLYGYFIDVVSEKLDLRYSNNNINWIIFEFIVNHKALLKNARVEVSKYRHRHKNPPEGDYIINNLLKKIDI